MLQVQNSMILDNSKLEQIWYILRQFVGLSNEAGGQDRLNYDEFCQVSQFKQPIIGTFDRALAFLTSTARSQCWLHQGHTQTNGLLFTCSTMLREYSGEK